MVTREKIKSLIVTTVSYLFMFLFVYAAVSKLQDFDNFQLQISQSPLLTAFAGFVARATIAVELIIAIILSIPRLRFIALLTAYTLMVLFSVYIFIILNYSPYVPCSCGGILEKMTWTQHLIFNLALVLIAAVAVLFSANTGNRKNDLYLSVMSLATLTVFSVVLMVVLFLTSENIIHHRNNFIRRIPSRQINKFKTVDLKFDSYYFAGEGEGKIYLGNYTTPSVVTEFDTLLQTRKEYRITLSNKPPIFKAVQLKVSPPYFFIADGTIPSLYRGKTSNWTAKEIQLNQKFQTSEIIDSSTLAIRAIRKFPMENSLGTIRLANEPVITFHPNLLQKQIDGLFDTDGTSLYSKKLKRFVYVYFYRNQYIVTDQDLKLKYRGNTIDTTTKAKLKVEYLKKRDQKKLAAPPFTVNRACALYNNLLFVHSKLPGKYDPLIMWKHASTVDVYDISSKTYVMSLYVYKIDGKEFDSFIISGNHMYALFGNQLTAYNFAKALKESFTTNK